MKFMSDRLITTRFKCLTNVLDNVELTDVVFTLQSIRRNGLSLIDCTVHVPVSRFVPFSMEKIDDQQGLLVRIGVCLSKNIRTVQKTEINYEIYILSRNKIKSSTVK